jgi:signal transduction histidine kinase
VETVAPLFTALLAVSTAISLLVRGPRTPLRQAYALLAAVIALLFLCLFFLVVSKLPEWRYPVLIAALLVVPSSLRVYAELVPRFERTFRRAIPAYNLLALLQVGVIIFLGPGSRLTIAINATLVFGGLVAQLLAVSILGSRLDRPSDRARISLLSRAGGVTIAAMALEMALLDWNLWGSRAQDPFLPPPVGSLATAAYVYLLGTAVARNRLPDNREALSRLLVFLALTLSMASIYGVVARLLGPGPGPFAEIVNIFLASVLIVILFEPLRDLVERGLGKVLAKERTAWLDAARELRRRLPNAIEVGPLLDALVDPDLLAGRIDLATVYLYEEDRGGYRLRRMAGTPEHDPVAAVPQRPFIEGFLEGRPWYDLDELLGAAVPRGGVAPPDWIPSVIGTLQSMHAEICLPLRIGRAVVGVWNVRALPGSAPWSGDELDALHGVAQQAATLVDNSRAFERMKERERLAALGEMAAGLAHEIRNPLGAIKGAVSVLARRARPQDGRDEFLGIIVEEVDRLNGVVSQFLDYARPVQVHTAPFRPDALLRGVLSMAEAEGLPPAVNVDFDPDPDLPDVPMDVEKVKQVAINALRNGLDAMAGRSGMLRIRAHVVGRDDNSTTITSLRSLAPPSDEQGVRVRRGGIATSSWLEIVFEDEGSGIDADAGRKLFIPFFTTKSGGTGLGLAICERIIRAHQGEIELRSLPGRGTTFIMRLPMGEGPG